MSEGMVEMTEADARELEFYRRNDAVQAEVAANKQSGAQMYAAVKRAMNNNRECFDELLRRARATQKLHLKFCVNDELVIMTRDGVDTSGYRGLGAYLGRELIMEDRSLAGTVPIRHGKVVSKQYPNLAGLEMSATVETVK